MLDETQIETTTLETTAPQEPSVSSEPTPEPQTAQTPVSEPLPAPAEQTPEPEAKSESSQPEEANLPLVTPQPKQSLARELLTKARNVIQFRKRKKLDKVMSLFLKQNKITNDEVEKFLHISDATATRYLSILEKENKIKQTGKTGKAVSYSEI